MTVLGLGAMGLPMAARLATRLGVYGFDSVPERLALAEEAGVRAFDTARSAAEGPTRCCSARDGAQLDDVLFGEAGVAEVLRPGAGRPGRGQGPADRGRRRADRAGTGPPVLELLAPTLTVVGDGQAPRR